MSKFTSEKIGRLAKPSNKGYELEVDVKYPKNYMTRIMTFRLCVKRWW